MKTLKDVKVGETVTVAKLHGEGPVKRRIIQAFRLLLRKHSLLLPYLLKNGCLLTHSLPCQQLR